MNKEASYIVNETFDKIAGIRDYKLRFTKDNPNKASKQEFDEFVAIGAKIDNNQATKEDLARFNELTPKIPNRFLSLPHFEKKAGVKDLFGAAKDVKHSKTMLNKMKDLAVEGAKKGNRSYGDMAGAGINEYEKALDFSKAMLRHEAKKVGKGVAIGAGATAAIGGTGAVLKKRKGNNEKTAFDIVDETFDKVAGIKNFGKVLTGKNVANAKALAEESATALGFVPGKGQKLVDGASDFMKKQIKEEAKKTRNARLLTGAGVAGGAAVYAKKNKKTKDK